MVKNCTYLQSQLVAAATLAWESRRTSQHFTNKNIRYGCKCTKKDKPCACSCTPGLKITSCWLQKHPKTLNSTLTQFSLAKLQVPKFTGVFGNRACSDPGWSDINKKKRKKSNSVLTWMHTRSQCLGVLAETFYRLRWGSHIAALARLQGSGQLLELRLKDRAGRVREQWPQYQLHWNIPCLHHKANIATFYCSAWYTTPLKSTQPATAGKLCHFRQTLPSFYRLACINCIALQLACNRLQTLPSSMTQHVIH